jgi:autotransporter passenger strand-loop-strand repeat protein
VVESGGQINVSAGGQAFNTVVSSDGLERVASNGAETLFDQNYTDPQTPGTVVVDGIYYVESGGQALGLTVYSGGEAVVSAGGKAFGTTVEEGGKEVVLSGGLEVVNAADYDEETTAPGVVQAFGAVFVSSGGSAEGLQVQVGGTVIVASGGTAEGTVVSSGGSELVSNGGFEIITQANFDTTDDEGFGIVTILGQTAVNSGGSAQGLIVSSGGGVGILAGGDAVNTVVAANGQEDIFAGGVETVLTSNFQGSPGAAGTITVQGTLNVGTPHIVASAAGLFVQSGGKVNVYGVAYNTSVDGGGEEVISNGGNEILTADNAYNGQIGDVTVGSGGLFVVSGVAAVGYGVDVHANGTLQVSDGAAATGAFVETGGVVSVGQGGAVFNTTLNGGQVTIAPNATASGSTIGAEGAQFVSGTVSGSLISGEEFVSHGGNSVSATIYNGGVQFIEGAAGGTIVGNGGRALIQGQGLATSLLVKNGGYADVSPGGTAIGVTVNAGGMLAAAGTLNGAIEDDGTIEADANLSLAGGLAGSGELIIDPGVQVTGLANGAIANLAVGGTLRQRGQHHHRPGHCRSRRFDYRLRDARRGHQRRRRHRGDGRRSDPHRLRQRQRYRDDCPRRDMHDLRPCGSGHRDRVRRGWHRAALSRRRERVRRHDRRSDRGRYGERHCPVYLVS